MQLDALGHSFFDELRDSNTRLPNGRFLPPLFNFKPHGMMSLEPFLCRHLALALVQLFKLVDTISCYCLPELKAVPVETLLKLIPEHARKQCPFIGL